jgi:hypothetical protein
MALLPHILASRPKKRAKKMRKIRAEEENDVWPGYAAEAIC